MITTIVKKLPTGFLFENGYRLESTHEQDCCESHYLCTRAIWDGEVINEDVDLSDPDLIEPVEDYGIRLKLLNGTKISVPGYSDNNGYYSYELTLVLYNDLNEVVWSRDITECQSSEDIYDPAYSLFFTKEPVVGPSFEEIQAKVNKLKDPLFTPTVKGSYELQRQAEDDAFTFCEFNSNSRYFTSYLDNREMPDYEALFATNP